MKLKSIKDIEDLRGKRVLVRVDFNVPLKNGKVVDDFRIKKVLPTIQLLKKKGARIILISHIGREKKESLRPVAEYLNKYLFRNTFIPEILGAPVVAKVNQMQPAEVVLLENLRSEAGEVRNTPAFARALGRLGDIYVNEAFSVCHRRHASIVLLPKIMPHYAGLQLEREVKVLGAATINPKHPFLFIVGGVKFETKMPLIKKYLRIADWVYVGGALANNFFKAEGLEIGRSVVDDKDFKLDKLLKNKKLRLPRDVIVSLPADRKRMATKKPDEVSKSEMIVDVGPESVKKLQELVQKSKFVIWNGPLGLYESGAASGTKSLLKILASSSAEVIIGGGDTVALVSALKLEAKFSFVSTGGGAMLLFLEKGTLPGIKALV